MSPPANYAVDHARARLGRGVDVYRKARAAVEQWAQFDVGWVQLRPRDTSIVAGENVAVLIRAVGVWWLNAARIVYVVHESTALWTRFGFAYGTLPGHLEAGEERFLIEWAHDDDSVWYDILAFSRPRHFLTRLGKWQVRRLQQRFRDDSVAAMLRAVSGEKLGPGV
jgi:uncharacterized protein (UPF0548 family)